MRKVTSRPDTCELCAVGYVKVRDGVLVIDHKGVISADLWRCPDGCGDEVLHLASHYHDDESMIATMVKHYPQHVHDLRQNIKIFVGFDGIGVLEMGPVFRELEASTFDTNMMEMTHGFAATEEKVPGVRFIFKPKSFLNAAAYLKIKRYSDPTGEYAAIDSAEAAISKAETSYNE